MQRLLCWLLLLATTAPICGAEIQDQIDAETGWQVITAHAGRTRIRIAPAAGFNVYSIEHCGRQLLKTPSELSEASGFMYGVPLLYPTPNRVRDAQFTFAGRTYQFEANNDANFLHGLVHNVPWTVTNTRVNDEEAAITAELKFAPGTDLYEKFPHAHTLSVTVTVRDGDVKWDYVVNNSEGDSRVPFGFALHPWFLYQGSRENTYLTIPATHWMEAKDLLPTGKLVDLAGSPFDARQPKSLKDFVIDDVYYGLTSKKPTLIDYRDEHLKISLEASDDFSHLVVYTPENADWFCVENQTCSTDAHNLYEQGLKQESGLLIAEPGKTMGGHAAFHIDDARNHRFGRWESWMDNFQARDRQDPPEPGGILFIGSSSIYFWDLAKYFPEQKPLNRGFGGSQMIDSLYFADRIVLPYQPRTIVVYAGDNDIDSNKAPETVAGDFRRFAAKVHHSLPETEIIYIAIKPSLARWNLWGKMERANQLITEFAEQDERITFADIATPMLNEEGTPKPGLFIKDGLHLNDAGYELWTSIIEPLLTKAEAAQR